MKPWAKYKGLASLALLLLIGPLFVWQYAVSDTVGRWRGTVKLQRQITALQAAQDHGERRQEISLSGTEMISSGLVVAQLLPTIESEGLKIEHFAPYITSETEGIRLATGLLSVEGTFTGIVKLLDAMERALPECRIVAAHYRSTKPRNRGAAKTLTCTIYIQQITAIDRL